MIPILLENEVIVRKERGKDITGRFKLDPAAIYYEITKSFDSLISILQDKKIKYEDLKSALIPQSKRKEVAFVFDSSKIDSYGYGLKVFTAVIPQLEKNCTNSILVGDYIGENSFAETLRIIFFDETNAVREIKYVHHSLFYIVYINNLSVGQFEKINQGLKPFEPYVGYFDLSYASFAKTCISTRLVRLIVKNRNKIIVGSEDSQDVNDLAYPFEKCGYILKGVETIY